MHTFFYSCTFLNHSEVQAKLNIIRTYLVLIERSIENNDMDASGKIEVNIPEPNLAAAIEERVVVTHNKTWLSHNSRNVIPAHAISNVSSSSKVAFC